MALTTEVEKLQKRWDENPLGLTFAPLAEAHRKAGDAARALELLELGLAQHPNYVPAHIVRGRCYLDSQADGDAQVAFLRVTELDPENVIALKALAELSERAGRLPEAVQRLEMLLDVDRNNEEARGQLDRVRDLLSSATAAKAPVVVARTAEFAPPSAPEPPPVETRAPEAVTPEVPAFVVSTPNFYSQRSDAPAAPQVEEPSQFLPVMAEEVPPIVAEEAPPALVEATLTSEDIQTSEEAQMPEATRSGFQPYSDDSMADIELDNSTELTSKPSGEFQIPNDAETLQPSAERIDDVTLGSGEDHHYSSYGDTESHADFGAQPSPVAEEQPAAMETGGVDALLGDDYASLLAYRPDTEEAAAPPPEMPSVHAEAEAPSVHAEAEAPIVAEASDMLEGFVPVGEDVIPPRVEVLPSSPEAPFEQVSYLATPEPVSEPEEETPPLSEPVLVAEPTWKTPVEPAEPPEGIEHDTVFEAPASEPESAGIEEEPELFVTETMAEIFLRQGHRELAYAVYAQLALREPANERIAAALARLTPEPLPPPPAPEPEPVGHFSAADTGGRSVARLFGDLLSAARPTPAPAIHPPAFEHPKRGGGEPTRPSQESLSLSAVFGEEVAPAGPAGTAAGSSSSEPSFDEFFAPATGVSSETELPRPAESDAMAAQVPEDLEQFNAWLRGLKR